MYDIIEKLLILQDRDRRIMQVQEQLQRIEPERETLHSQTSSAIAALDAAKTRNKQIESDRKQRELEVEGKKSLIGKYSLQQFQTKKNEEYRALALEIEHCQADITKLEDSQLELMEQAEGAQREMVQANRQSDELKKVAAGQLADLANREKALSTELAELEAKRNEVKAAVEEDVLKRYERLLKLKGGGSVVVGIQHGVCGGCHMKIPVQLVVSCQAGRELVSCPNCGRLLYSTPDMDLAFVD